MYFVLHSRFIFNSSLFYIQSVTVKEVTVNSLLREDNDDKVIGVVAQSKTNEESKVREKTHLLYTITCQHVYFS